VTSRPPTRILLADTESALNNAIADALRNRGFEAAEAKDGLAFWADKSDRDRQSRLLVLTKELASIVSRCIAAVRRFGETATARYWLAIAAAGIALVANTVLSLPQLGLLVETGCIFWLTSRLRATQSFLRLRTVQLGKTASALLVAEERERERLARVLHDELQQLLVAAKYGAEILANTERKQLSPETARQVAGVLETALQVSRMLTSQSLLPVACKTDFAKALTWLAGQMERLHGLRVRFAKIEGGQIDCEATRLLLFRSVRELLLNVVKHAKVKDAEIEINPISGGQLRVDVTDNGVGCDLSNLCANTGSAGGFGLDAIRERFQIMGGQASFFSTPGMGFRATLVVPLAEGSANAAG